MSKKKITKVGNSDQSSVKDTVFKPTSENKGKATKYRVIASLFWLFAIGAQVAAISLLFKEPINMTYIIILIVIDLGLAIGGSIFWKKSNRLDPASEKNKFMFFMQSQLGLVVAIIAFLPLVIFILKSDKLSGKQKGILGGIAGIALLVAGVTGTDFNPPSVEQYTEQTARVEELTGKNEVFWTEYGTKYHIYQDCHSINKDVTSEIFVGGVANARELKNITELCKFCENRASKDETLKEAIEESKTQLNVE